MSRDGRDRREQPHAPVPADFGLREQGVEVMQGARQKRPGLGMLLLIGVPHILGGFGILLWSLDAWWAGLVFIASGALLIGGACWQAGWGWRVWGLIVAALAAAMVAVRMGMR